jgi:two-component system, OmpR family, sensor histidine kinase MprB
MAARVRRISFRTRLGILVATAVGVTVALACLASYLAVSHQLFSQVDSALVTELSNAAGASPDCGVNPNCLDPSSVSRYLSRYGGGYLQVVDGQQHIWWPRPTGPTTGPMFPVNQSEAAMASTSRYNIQTIRYGGQKYRVITAGGYVATDAFGNQVAVAVQIFRPLSDIEHTLRDLRLILWLVTIGGVVVAVGLGYLIGKTTMRPVTRLTAAAEHVAATQDLDAKIEEQGDDELARLARSFNSMLAALATSREQQRQLISDAGHELRTPLTSLRTNIEVLMRVRDLPEEDRAELMADVNAQLEELTTLIGDVVDVARDDERHADPIEFRLDNVVDHAIERARRRAPTVTFEARIIPGSVRGHPALLERAVLNVLDNAAKWSPQGGVVTVWLQRLDRWTLDVRDQGPGIDAADLPHVFERFYRAESARSMSGSGLGLAIVRKVITDHGGSVTASCPPGGGTLIHIELPTVEEQELDAVGGEAATPAPPSAEPDAETTDPANPYGDPAQPKSEGQSGPVHVR